MFRRIGLLSLLLFAVLAAPGAARAQALVAFDLNSGKILASTRADTLHHPASLTKMMTLYIAFAALDSGLLDPHQELPVSEYAASQPRSKLGLRAGSTISAEDAARAMVVKSANDMAVVMAEAIAGSEEKFVEIMNRFARELGMKSTTFRNANGLTHHEQKTTARDMATLGVALAAHYPHYYYLFSTPYFTYKGRTYGNTNKLLARVGGADGLKTGYTSAAGYNLAATARQGNKRVIVVGLGYRTSGRRNAAVRQQLARAFKTSSSRLAAAPTVKLREPSLQPFRRLVAGSVVEASRRADAFIANPPPELPDLAEAPEIAEDDASLAAAAPALAPEPVNAPTWGVQVGAFGNIGAADRLAQQVRRSKLGSYDGLRVRVDTASAQGHLLYKAQIFGFSSKKEAKEACRRLSVKKRRKSSRSACMVVEPASVAAN
ncbi:hypothetical protein FACS1894186_7350 [Alphaproteobacteria bacterium]|nr:hypothetical protein FACS1894186_7350 [Alphaproteobacteria bacterium]